ncbi:MAG: GFA family protein [Devosia sp.]
MVRTGSCLCGQVQYRLEGEPYLVGMCHCQDCRKESGSMFTTYAKWRPEQFSYSGKLNRFAGRSFCPDCGSRLFNLNEDNVETRVGTLDEARMGLMPQQEGWTKRREHWLAPLPGIPQFAEDTSR